MRFRLMDRNGKQVMTGRLPDAWPGVIVLGQHRAFVIVKGKSDTVTYIEAVTYQVEVYGR